MKRMMCRHCKRNGVKPNGKRSGYLCFRCHEDPVIKAMYKPAKVVTRANANAETMEDIERIIAEQMQCLPDDWDRPDEDDDAVSVRASGGMRLVKRGRVKS